MPNDLASQSIVELRERLADGSLEPSQFLKQCLRVADDHSGLNAFITPPRFRTGQTADSDGVLGGIPVAIKDNICTADFRTTAGSRMLEEYRPVRDATAVARLREEGAVVFGKTNLDEFAMGGTTEHSAFGSTSHPLDADRVPGGSSGGSAVCVAAGICPAALGSDTGGSVRQPASFCGVFGFKPTWGRVSRRGLIAFASSLDQIGWFTRTVDDAALLFSVVAGPDPNDATCRDAPPPAVGRNQAGASDPQQLTVGVPRNWIADVDVQPEIRPKLRRWCDRLQQAGVKLVDVELATIDLAEPAYQVIATAEASSNLARFDGVRYGSRAESETLDELYEASRTEGFGREVKRRILLGAYTLSEGHVDKYFEQACRVRQVLIDEFRAAFETVDVLLTPTTPTTAFEQGRQTGPLGAYAGDAFTIPASLAGLPAMSLPAGEDDQGMPFGIQLMGAAWDEPTLFGAARLLESLSNPEADQ